MSQNTGVPATGPRLRPVTVADDDVLWAATERNVNWQEPRFDRAAIAADPKIRHYCELRPERGDFGLAADLDGTVVGVVWLLLLGDDDPGYGSMDDETPELSVCVWEGHRRRGLGRALMVAALDEARTRGFPRVSLSVEDGNPAVELYRSLGFSPVPAAPAGTYVLSLWPTSPGTST